MLHTINTTVQHEITPPTDKTLEDFMIGIFDDDFQLMQETTDFIDYMAVRVTLCLMYGVIFVLGFFGNILVCFVVFRNRDMQTVTNLFITNLALSDMLLCMFGVPLLPTNTFVGRWIFGKMLCKLWPYAQITSIYISSLTLTSIAMDRFYVITYPYNTRMKLTTCLIIIVFIWIFSLAIASPQAIFMQIEKSNNNDFCFDNWPSERSRIIFGVFTSVFQFVIPFVVITICYTFINIRLNEHARSKPGAKNAKREEADRDRTKKTNRMLISVVAIFGISWLPNNLIYTVASFYNSFVEWRYYMFLFFLAHLMAMASTCYNPFLYAWLNENFRKEFKRVFSCSRTAGVVRNSNNIDQIPTHKSDIIINIIDANQDTPIASSFNKDP